MRAVAVCLALGTPLWPAATGAAELTLDAALVRARTANPSLAAAAAELEAARGRRIQAGLLPANPVLSGDMARHTEPGAAQIDRGVALAQEIEVGGQRGLRVAGADHDVARAELLLAEPLEQEDAAQVIDEHQPNLPGAASGPPAGTARANQCPVPQRQAMPRAIACQTAQPSPTPQAAHAAVRALP